MDLSGKFLVAPPTMRDWRFARTVIYLWKHDVNGASGVIINRPVESSHLTDICKDGKIPIGEGINAPIHYGGPIGENIVGCLHTLDYKMPCTNVFGNCELGYTLERKIIEDIAMGRGPEKYLITAGMCHWSPGQLETEIEAYPPRSKKESWLVMEYDPNLIFTESTATFWNQAVNISVAENSKNYLDKFFQ